MARKPLAVKKRAEAADQRIRELSEQINGVEHPLPLPTEAAPVEGDPGEARAVPAPAAAPEPEPAAAAPDQPPADPAPEPGAEPAATGGDDYEQKYRVLQGKYNAETQRMREDMDGLRRTLALLQDSIARPTAPAPAPAAPAPAPAAAPIKVGPAPQLVSQREKDDFGADLLEVAARSAREQWQPEVDALKAEVARLRKLADETSETAKTVKTTVATDARSRMHQLLDREVADWRAINVDDGFKAWLAQEDDLTGEQRQTLLLRAYERNDAQRVLAFFRKYTAEHANAGNPAPTATSTTEGNTTPAAASAPKVDPNALVSPGRGKAAPRAGTQQPQIIWTPPDIAAFYADSARGAFKNNPEERDRLERDIFAAQQEGRVRAA